MSDSDQINSFVQEVNISLVQNQALFQNVTPTIFTLSVEKNFDSLSKIYPISIFIFLLFSFCYLVFEINDDGSEIPVVQNFPTTQSTFLNESSTLNTEINDDNSADSIFFRKKISFFSIYFIYLLNARI